MTYKYNNQECHERTPTASKKDEWCLQTDIVNFVFPKDRPNGYLAAIDPMTGKSKWQMPWTEMPSWSGTLSTAGKGIKPPVYKCVAFTHKDSHFS